MNQNLPPNYTSLASALVSLFGSSTRIARTDRISGGDINKAYGLTLSNGEHIFMKANAKENANFFMAEAAGLSAIKSTNAIATPEILCTGTDDGEEVGYSFLLMKFIESGEKRSDFWEIFAQELAAMHKSSTKDFVHGGNFGFFADNFIGFRGQSNAPSENWISFFRDSRLLPQFEAAKSNFSVEEWQKITKLLDNLETFLVEPEFPSLLHGDLWGGNVMCDSCGKGMLIDPACSVGNREADLAMTELFGGFSRSFYDSYKNALPLQSGYEERRDLYNLYHLLNHLNMFGKSYLAPVLSIVSEYVD